MRRFLTDDLTYRTLQFPDHTEWHGDTSLNLLRQVGSHNRPFVQAGAFG